MGEHICLFNLMALSHYDSVEAAPTSYLNMQSVLCLHSQRMLKTQGFLYLPYFKWHVGVISQRGAVFLWYGL